MADLTPFTEETDQLEAPPDDSIAGAAWLAKLLRKELHEVASDPSLTAAERRDGVLKFAKAIISSTPNHELYEAREEIRDDENESKLETLTGTVTDAPTPGARRLRANSPRQTKH